MGFHYGYDIEGKFLGVFNIDVVGCFSILVNPDGKQYHIAAFNKAHASSKNISPGNELFVLHPPGYPYSTFNDAALAMNRIFGMPVIQEGEIDGSDLVQEP